MPKGGKKDRCVRSVKRQGKSESAAWAICNASVKTKKKRRK